MKKWCLSLCLLLLIFAAAGARGASAFSMFPEKSDNETGYPSSELLTSPGTLWKYILFGFNIAIIDVRTAEEYAAGHIPRAVNLKFADFVASGGKLKDDATLESKLGAAGIKRTMKIFVYDSPSSSWGAAGRMFWMLEYLGCKDVHLLNGGWERWVSEKRRTKTTATTLRSKTFTAQIDNATRAYSSHILERLTAGDDTNSFSDFAFVDSRTEEEYNGWQFYGETRGGHIATAVNIPYTWLMRDDGRIAPYETLKKIFEDRGITTDKEVAAYCTVGLRSGFNYFVMRLMGYTRASNYDGSITEWSADPSLPMSKLQRYQTIVNAGWVNALINSTDNASTWPATYPGKGYKIFEVVAYDFSDKTTRYDAGHIPGAYHLNVCNFDKSYNLDNDSYIPDNASNTIDGVKLDYGAKLQAKLEALGITDNTTVVLYEYWDATWASRAAWVLLYAGVKDVRILNGGWEAWKAGGYAIETTSNTPTHADFGATVPVHPEYRGEMAEVKKIIADNETGIMADARSWDEYIGAIVGYDSDFETWTGRIPGSVWIHDWDWYYHFKDDTAYSDDIGGKFRSYTEVEHLWKSAGLRPDIRTLTYCGFGFRASISFMYGYMMGYDIANYDGSWWEWGFTTSDDNATNDNPIETGYPASWRYVQKSQIR